MDTNVLIRLERLESQLRRWKLLSMIAVALLTMILLAGVGYSQRADLQQDPASRLISRSFVLVGVDGSVYARLTTKAGEPVMQFYDHQGNVVWSAPPKAEVKNLQP
jgi:putative Ca2+/H+ antiporter (TMEM165/GDT1 family)